MVVVMTAGMVAADALVVEVDEIDIGNRFCILEVGRCILPKRRDFLHFLTVTAQPKNEFFNFSHGGCLQPKRFQYVNLLRNLMSTQTSTACANETARNIWIKALQTIQAGKGVVDWMEQHNAQRLKDEILVAKRIRENEFLEQIEQGCEFIDDKGFPKEEQVEIIERAMKVYSEDIDVCLKNRDFELVSMFSEHLKALADFLPSVPSVYKTH
jgi:hypothetical protein